MFRQSGACDSLRRGGGRKEGDIRTQLLWLVKCAGAEDIAWNIYENALLFYIHCNCSGNFLLRSLGSPRLSSSKLSFHTHSTRFSRSTLCVLCSVPVVISYNHRVHTHIRSERRKQSAKLMKMSSKIAHRNLPEFFSLISRKLTSPPHQKTISTEMNGNNFYQLQHKFS